MFLKELTVTFCREKDHSKRELGHSGGHDLPKEHATLKYLLRVFHKEEAVSKMKSTNDNQLYFKNLNKCCSRHPSSKIFKFSSKHWRPDSPFTYIFQLYDSRVTTTNKSLLVDYLRGNRVLENGKALGIVSKSNALGLHFISSSSGYGIGKYGFNGTITAGEQILKVDPRILHYEIWVVAYQLQIKVLWFSLLHCAFSLSRPREPIKLFGRFQS